MVYKAEKAFLEITLAHIIAQAELEARRLIILLVHVVIKRDRPEAGKRGRDKIGGVLQRFTVMVQAVVRVIIPAHDRRGEFLRGGEVGDRPLRRRGNASKRDCNGKEFDARHLCRRVAIDRVKADRVLR